MRLLLVPSTCLAGWTLSWTVQRTVAQFAIRAAGDMVDSPNAHVDKWLFGLTAVWPIPWVVSRLFVRGARADVRRQWMLGCNASQQFFRKIPG